jgi:acyl dehydratase
MEPSSPSCLVIDRAHIGRTWPPFEVEVEKGRLRLFAKAIGETRPVYHDEAAARAAGYRSILAPPTFAFCLGADDPNGLDYLDELGVPMGRMLHGEQRITLLEPICAGDRVSVSRKVGDIYEKKNGALEFIVFESEVRDRGDDRVLARGESVLVVRNG